MKMKEIRAKSKEELIFLSLDLYKIIASMKFSGKLNPSSDFKEIDRKKKSLARVKTILRQIELNGEYKV